jgi:hypothetical protein
LVEAEDGALLDEVGGIFDADIHFEFAEAACELTDSARLCGDTDFFGQGLSGEDPLWLRLHASSTSESTCTGQGRFH